MKHVVLLFAASLIWVVHPAWAANGLLKITADSSGWTIFIDGQAKGVTVEESERPLSLELAEGAHVLLAVRRFENSELRHEGPDVFVSRGLVQAVHLNLAQIENKLAKDNEEKRRARLQEELLAKGVVSQGRFMLMRCPLGQAWSGHACTGTANRYTWQQAMALSQSYAGYSDWRLPTREELLIIRYCKAVGGYQTYSSGKLHTNCADMRLLSSFDQKNLFNTSDSWFWSASTVADYAGYAWVIHFDNGYDYWDLKDYIYPVRLVRSQ